MKSIYSLLFALVFPLVSMAQLTVSPIVILNSATINRDMRNGEMYMKDLASLGGGAQLDFEFDKSIVSLEASLITLGYMLDDCKYSKDYIRFSYDHILKLSDSRKETLGLMIGMWYQIGIETNVTGGREWYASEHDDFGMEFGLYMDFGWMILKPSYRHGATNVIFETLSQSEYVNLGLAIPLFRSQRLFSSM